MIHHFLCLDRSDLYSAMSEWWNMHYAKQQLFVQRRSVDRTSMPNTFVLSFRRQYRSNSSCIPPVRIFWAFDNNLLDFYGNFRGASVNSPAYQTPDINGYGSCLYLNAFANQSMKIPSPPFLTMADTSFSFSAWVIANSLRTVSVSGCRDNAIFG